MKRAKKNPRNKNNFHKLNIFAIALLIFIIAFFLISLFGGFLRGQNTDTPAPAPVAGQRINLLITGLDQDNLRTDLVMIASFNTATKKVDILSIPDNTRMYVGGRYQKISAAHAIKKGNEQKGISGTIEALNRLTAIPLNYYIEFSQDAFKDFLENLGDVDFYVPQRMKYKDPFSKTSINLKKGEQTLSSKEALDLVRFVSYDDGPITRSYTQQDFCMSLAEQKLTPEYIKDFPKFAQELDIKTNLKANDIIKYSNMILDFKSDDITFHTLTGHEEKGPVTYWIPDIDSLKILIKDVFGYNAENITTDKIK